MYYMGGSHVCKVFYEAARTGVGEGFGLGLWIYFLGLLRAPCGLWICLKIGVLKETSAQI